MSSLCGDCHKSDIMVPKGSVKYVVLYVAAIFASYTT